MLTLQSETQNDLVYLFEARCKEAFGWSCCVSSPEFPFVYRGSGNPPKMWSWTGCPNWGDFEQSVFLNFWILRTRCFFWLSEPVASPACYSQFRTFYKVHVNLGRPEPVTQEHRRAVCPTSHSPMGTARCCSKAFPALLGMSSEQLHQILFIFSLFMPPLDRAGTRCPWMGITLTLTAIHALLLLKRVNFRATVSRWLSQTAQTQTKVTLVTGWVTAPMG